MHVSLCLLSLGYIKMGNAGPEGICISQFNRHCQITLQKDCTNFLSHQQSFNFRNQETEAQRLYSLPNTIKI